MESLQKEMATALADERKKADAAKKKAEEAVRLFEDSQRDFAEREEQRRQDILSMRDNMDAMRKDLDERTKKGEIMLAEERARHQRATDDWKRRVDMLLKDKDRTLLMFPDILKDNALLLENKKLEWQEKNQGLKDKVGGVVELVVNDGGDAWWWRCRVAM